MSEGEHQGEREAVLKLLAEHGYTGPSRCPIFAGLLRFPFRLVCCLPCSAAATLLFPILRVVGQWAQNMLQRHDTLAYWQGLLDQYGDIGGNCAPNGPLGER